MKNALKKLAVIPVMLCILISCIVPMWSSAAFNDEVKFDSNIVYMESLDQGTVIFSKNADERTAMASLTKITTAMVVLNNVKNLDTKITATQSVMDTLANTNSSTAGITTGETLTVRQLLSLMMVHSANEAAAILADYVGGGSISNFVGMMNSYAKKLGCTNTHYTNPHGLDDADHYSTAKDLSKIIKDALKNDTFKKLVAQPTYTLEATNKRDAYTYPSTNYLLNPESNYYYEACKGIKTGTTEEAGQCLASYATKNGYTYLLICIGGADAYKKSSEEGTLGTNIAFNDSVRAYEWAFSNIKLKVVAKPSDVVTVVNVGLGRGTDHVRLVPAQEVTALIPSNVDSSGVSIVPSEKTIPKNLKAPIKAGQKIGKANVIYAGDVLCTVDLAAAETVHRGFFTTIGYGFKWVFTHTIAKIILLIVVLVILALILIDYLYKKKKRNSRVHLVRVRADTRGTHPLKTVSNAHPSRQPTRKRKK